LLADQPLCQQSDYVNEMFAVPQVENYS